MNDREGALEDGGFTGERTVVSETSEVVTNPSPHLVVLTGDRAGRHVPLDRTVLVGRGVDCQLHLDVDDVSRRHAEIRASEDGGFMVQDLGSQNGTWVNGVPVEVQPLRPGDRVRFGGKTVAMLSMFGDLESELMHQQRLESLGVLAGGIAHDYNNLMAVVLGNAEYLGVLPHDTPLGDEGVRSTIEDLRAAAQHAAELSRQLLGLARRSAVDEQVIELSHLVDEVVRIVRRKLGPGVDVEISVREPLVLIGDPAQLRQVLMNLCVNANDAMPEGGRLTLRAWREVADSGEIVRVEVEDTGVGMSEDSCARAFEPFYTGKALGRGTGMGLAIAKRIVLNHGGAIGVHSAPGQGTVFRFWLPVQTRADRATPPTRPAVQTPLATEPARGAVLVLDDDELHARTLQRTLGHLGFPTLTARTAEEGTRLVRAMAPQVGLTIVNTDLGGIGALAACRALRELHPEVKLMLAAGAMDEQLRELEEAVSPEVVLLKPFDRVTLRQELQRLLT